jgi:hypothetical protein
MSVISEVCIAERATVDPADPWTLKGVKLLGKNSINHRTYPRPVQEAAIPLFEGKKIYVDHGDLDGKRPINRKRGYGERLGIIKKGTVVVDPVTESTHGDVRLNPKHPFAEMALEDYRNETSGVGFSIAADCIFAGGSNIGECLQIKKLFSVDLVDDAATAITMTEAAASETQYEQGKEHGEMRAKLDEHETRLAEHAKRHEEHQAKIDGHDGEHRTHHERHAEHERRIHDCEASMAKTVEQYQALGGPEHAAALEQWQTKQAAAEKAVAEANKLIAESKEAFKKVPRTPNAGNPLETRSKTAVPVMNGDGLKKPNFTRN